METEIRIVAAVIHNDTNEVEIIVEKTINKGIDKIEKLVSIWIDCEIEMEKRSL